MYIFMKIRAAVLQLFIRIHRRADRSARCTHQEGGGEEFMQVETGVETKMNSYLVFFYVIHTVGILIINKSISQQMHQITKIETDVCIHTPYTT